MGGNLSLGPICGVCFYMYHWMKMSMLCCEQGPETRTQLISQSRLTHVQHLGSVIVLDSWILHCSVSKGE